MDLEGLNWLTVDDFMVERPFIDLEEQAKGTGAHLAEIYQKDFSSIKGTWKNNKGGEVTFDEYGFTNGAVLTRWCFGYTYSKRCCASRYKCR